MKTAGCVVLIGASLLVFGCGGKKKNQVSSLVYGDLRAASQPAPAGIADDEYRSVALDAAGTSVLYVVAREVKEGWGLGHGNELIAYNLEKKMKLPLGKLGRSTLVKVIQLGDELRNAVVRTVDTDGNGDIDERDANQLYVTSVYGLDEAPVSPVGMNVTGVWQDPQMKWVVYAAGREWEGRRKRKNENVDPVPVVFAWDQATLASTELATCDRFYGFSPDGKEFGCLAPGQDPAGERRTVSVHDRATRAVAWSASLPVTAADDVVLLGGRRLAYSRADSGESGRTAAIWLHGGGKNDTRVTDASVTSRVLAVLGDGTLLFTSRAEESVADAVKVRALGPDGAEVATLFTLPGAGADSIGVAPSGSRLAWLAWPAGGAAEGVKAKVMTAALDAEPARAPAAKVAKEYVEGLGASILKGLTKAVGPFPSVLRGKLRVDVRGRRAFIPVDLGDAKDEEARGERLVAAARELKEAVVPVLAGKGYTGVVHSPALADAVALLRREERWGGGYFTWLSAYGEEVPVREEYGVVVEDLAFRKAAGCSDPRMVRLHCSGWLVTQGAAPAGSLSVSCTAVPLNPMQNVREERVDVAPPAPGAPPAAFDVTLDKVDPRRSHRYSYSLAVQAGGAPVPWFDALDARASMEWIRAMRRLRAQLPSALLPYSGRSEELAATAVWRPDSVVARDHHLDVHVFLTQSPGLPSGDDQAGWKKIALTVAAAVDAHAAVFDPERAGEGRVMLYQGSEFVYEFWHKTPEELFEEMLQENPDWEPPPAAKGKKGEETYDAASMLPPEFLKSKVGELKPKASSATIERAAVQQAISSHMPEVRACYEKEAAGGSAGSGQVTVKMVVGPSGSVESASVSSATLKNDNVHACILKAVRRWKFPKPQGEGSVVVNYPFSFAAK